METESEFGDSWGLGVRLPYNFGDWELGVDRKIFRLHIPAEVENGTQHALGISTDNSV